MEVAEAYLIGQGAFFCILVLRCVHWPTLAIDMENPTLEGQVQVGGPHAGDLHLYAQAFVRRTQLDSRGNPADGPVLGSEPFADDRPVEAGGRNPRCPRTLRSPAKPRCEAPDEAGEIQGRDTGTGAFQPSMRCSTMTLV